MQQIDVVSILTNKKDMVSRLFFCLCALFVMCSCGTTYYYAQLDSTDPYMVKNDKGMFVVEGDSIRISYSFSGENAPLKVGVFNKSKQTIYMDWENSWFNFGNQEGNVAYLSDYKENGEVLMSIDPGSERRNLFFELKDLKFDKIKDKNFKPEQIILSNGKTKEVFSSDFNEANSPLYMRGLITFYLGNTNSDPYLYEQDFYIRKVIKAGGLSPEKIASVTNKQGDMFFTKKEHGKGFKNVLSISGQVLLITGAVALDVILSVDEIKNGE